MRVCVSVRVYLGFDAGLGLSSYNLLRFVGSRTGQRNVNVLVSLQQIHNHLRTFVSEHKNRRINVKLSYKPTHAAAGRRDSFSPLDENIADTSSEVLEAVARQSSHEGESL